MKLNATEMISRTTISSSRNLWLLASTLIAVNYYGLNSTDWQIFQKELQPFQFSEIACLIIVFQIINHFIHWYSDYIAYSKWFKINETNIGTFDSSSDPIGKESVLEGLIRRLTQIEESNQRAVDPSLDLESFKESDLKSVQGDRNVAMDLQKMRDSISKNENELARLSSEISGVGEILKTLGTRFETVSRVSKFLVFVWYLALPISVGVISLLCNWKSVGAYPLSICAPA